MGPGALGAPAVTRAAGAPSSEIAAGCSVGWSVADGGHAPPAPGAVIAATTSSEDRSGCTATRDPGPTPPSAGTRADRFARVSSSRYDDRLPPIGAAEGSGPWSTWRSNRATRVDVTDPRTLTSFDPVRPQCGGTGDRIPALGLIIIDVIYPWLATLSPGLGGATMPITRDAMLSRYTSGGRAAGPGSWS